MNCQNIRKKLFEYLDNELSQDQAKQIEEHLEVCPNCSAFLEEIKLIESEARKVKIEEPAQEYWDNFSLRVKEKIQTLEEKSFGFKLKKFFENILTFSPAKLKWATAVTSILLIFVVGIFWLKEKGPVQIPKKEIPTIQPTDTLPKEKQIEPQAPKGTDEMAKSKGGIQTAPKKSESPKVGIPQPAELKKAPTQAELEQPAQSPKQKETVAGAILQSIEVTTEKPVITKDVTTQEKTRGGKAGESLRIVSPQNIAVAPENQVLAGTFGFVSLDKYGDVRELNEIDSVLTEIEILSVLDFWKKCISEKIDTISINKGIEQVSIGYFLLAKTTKKKGYIDDGISTLEKYLDKITSSDTRIKVEQKLSYLKSLKEK